MKVNYLLKLAIQNKALRVMALLLLTTFSSYSQIGVQSPSIRENVTFQWSDVQDTNNNGLVTGNERNLPATIESITVDGVIYNTFAVPSAYQLTRLGPGGNNINQIKENGSTIVNSSATATQNINDSNLWDSQALLTFESKNLNRYYTSNGNGANICGNFNAANGTNGVTETNAQMQTLIYDPALPSNEGGILAVTERGGNNCFYVRLFGTLPGSDIEEPLGDTFVRTSGGSWGNVYGPPPNNNSDYWRSGRVLENGQTIAIALFELNRIAPTGSKISKIRFISASTDDGDGKFFVLQRYALPQIDLGCLGQGTFNGQIHNESSAPEGSTYELVSPPSPTGLNFNLNPDGSYTYTPTSNFVGDVTFKYLVRLPTPNNNITDTNTVTLTFNSLPEDPELEITCGSTTGKYNVEITSPIGSQYEYRADAFNGGAYQDSPDFENLTPGTYNFTIRDVMTGCESSSISTTITSETLKATIVSNTPVDCHGEATGSIDINVSGGYPPYTYLWSNGETTQDITGVPSGSYNVDITDDSGCLFTFATDVIVNEPKALTATAAQDSPVVCFGEANGSATVTPAGGNGNYTYSWDNGETTATATALNAGTHTVTITDDKDCKTTATVNITQPSAALTATAAQDSPVVCFGEANGSATVTPAGGNGNYTYSWDNGETTATATALNVGSHTVTITDDKDCKTTATVTITQPSAALTATAAQDSPVVCFGEANGSATVTPAGGNGNYTYSWDNGETTATATALNAGTHTVTITDDKDCKTTATVTITQPSAALTATAAQDSPVVCFGEANGSATVTPAGGNGNYTYSWDNGETTATATALNAGTHTVTITDDKDCKTTATVNITQPSAALTATAAQDSPVVCFREANGSATVTPAGGNGNYTYSWDNGENTATATALNAGTHTVTITDDKDCKTTATVNITQPSAALTATAAQDSPVVCFGEANGSATVTPAGGNGNYTYSWDNGETTATATALNAGTHTVTITDDKDCKTTATVNITQPSAALTATAAQDSPVVCFGEANGSATVTPAGGNGNYTYSWDNGETTATATALNAGSHTVTITDDKDCKTTATVNITQPSAALTATAAQDSPVVCFGEANGSATVTPAGGNGNYTYSWDNGETTATATALNAGTHTVTITDDKDCKTTATVTITQPSAALTATAAQDSPVVCFGEANGSATVTPAGGNGNYTYSWDNGETTATATALNAGSHTVTITDDKDCKTTATVNITQPSAALTATAAQDSPVVCFGEANGSATVTPAGGNGNYTYSWDNGETTATATALNAGTHTVTITDDKDCKTTATVNITQPSAALTATAAQDSPVVCFGEANGSATVTPAGGNGNYTYSWDNGETTATATALNAGTHTVTITDDKDCKTTATVTITQPSAALTATAAQDSPVVCFGEANGSATVTPAGGNGNYTYSWDNGETTATATALNAGTHTVTITDDKDCKTTATVNITQPSAALTATAAQDSPVVCFGEANGSATVTPAGGNGNYTYSWDNGETTATATALNAGTHTVTITDDKDCKTTATVTITQPSAALTATAAQDSPVVCFGEANGSATVTPAGGNGNYTYSWDNGETTATATALNAGSHTVTITDDKDCKTTATVNITQPSAALTATAAQDSPVVCFGEANGSATVTPAGGNGNYTYSWDNGETTATATALNAGTHTVTITDDKDCKTTATVNITQPSAALTATAAQDSPVVCFGEANGSATVTPAGGNGNYTYSWDNGETTATATALNAGTHTVTITDDKDCKTTATVTITQPSAALTATAAQDSPVVCFGEANGSATVTPAGGNGNYTYSWDNGETTATATALNAGTHTVTITDDKDCKTTATVNITQPSAALTATAAQDSPVVCFGEANGSATVTPAGGNGNYTYSWDNGETTATATALNVGSHTVTITDDKDCKTTATVTITQPSAALTATAAQDSPVVCFGEANGSATVTPAGGNGNYTYSWDNGETTATATALNAGTHTVTITDDKDCKTTATVNITQPSAALTASITSVTDVLCNSEATGSIDISVDGGTAPYTFVWNDTNNSTTEDLSNVIADAYNVTITDANGCTTSIGATISEPTSPLSLNITKIDATTAQGCANGEATAIVSGGTSDYTYQWSASAGNVTTATASNLSNGTHSVTITDANNCQLTQSIVIECVNTCDAEITIADVTDVLCTGDDTGAATVTANSEANPSATFTFTWSNGQVDTGVTSSTLSAVNAGVYSVSVTIDGTVCQAVEETVSITEPSNALNITATTTDELGPNTGDGTASSVTTGGVEPYTYSWSPNGETTSNITNLTAGSYSVTVTDANGCTDTTTVTVNPGSCLNLSVTGNSTPAVCFGEENGSVTATVTGGSGNFTYAWDIIPNTTASVSDLPAGDYTITVTDTTTLCTTSTTITINEPNVLSSAIAVSNILCKDDATGSLDLAVNGGTAPYVFAWDNGDTSEDLINVIAGTYNVTITDANGCTTTNSATIIEPDTNVSASITEQTNISCEGLGSITVEGAGGISPYSYSIDGGANYQTTGVFTDLPEDIYTITVIDANGCSITVNTEILINCTDAIADINNTFIDQPVTGNVLTNDEDYEGDAQTVTDNTDPANGTVVVNPDGTYTYTPNAGFTGQDSFEYTICDDGNPQACDTATVYIEVLPTSGPGNEAPIANADTATTPEGTPINVPVITNDFDPDGDAITVTETTDPANGTVTLNPDGTITYTPEDGFTGEDTFTYTICDDANPALCDTATVTVTVQPTDSPNSTNANDDAYTTTPDTVISDNVLANDNDIEGDAQTVTDNTQPANGTVTIDANGDFTYTPNADFTGTDAFTYTICDDNADQACDTATVYITVGGIANTTDAIADINNTFIDQPVTGNVLTNDEDYEGDAQTVTDNTDPANGTVVVNPDGTYTYTPNAGFTGQDSFEYTICDDGNPQACDTATVYIEVLPTSGPGNEAPIANADTATTPEGTPINVPVITNDFDPDGDAITVTETTDPANGTVTLNPDGTITYTPEDGFTGEDTFTYTICDDANPALCDTATVTVTVQPTDSPNSTNANDDAYTTTPDTVISDNVLANDNDIEGDAQTVTDNTQPANGTVTIDANGDFTYTPNADFTGTDAFTYTICDDNADQACDTATVYITVGGIANTTDAIADINNTFIDQPVTGNVLTNDEDYEGDAQTVTDNTDPANGTVVVNPDGTYTYTPNAGFTGQDSFEYTICDDGNPQACDTATVYIEVLPTSGPGNEAPIANADTATTPEGTPINVPVITNDFDPDGDAITVTETTDPANGTVTLNPDGTITYTPEDGFTGEDTFTYTICDDANPALCDTATVTVTVQPTDSPNSTNANDDAYTTTPDTVISDNVLANDNDIEGDAQTVTDNTQPANGTVTIDANGDFTYTPNADFTGTDAFTYTICDDNADQACDTATVYITVGGIANTTDAIADINNTFIDQPVTGNVLTNDEDYEGDAQTVTDNTDPANGTVVVNPDGTYTYTPNAGFTGQDSFEYTICDDGNPQACDTATVYIEVLPTSGPGNEAPIANADTATTPEGTPINVPVITNDFDPDGDAITVTETTDPANGTVTLNPDGTITYTPEDGFTGEDTFTYTICDDANPALCDTATVTVTVQPTDSPNSTNANDDAYTTTPDTVISDNVLANDNDIEGDAQTVTDNTQPANGTVTIDANGDFTYTPNADFTGTDAFTYTICDDNADQACDTATVYITVGGIANTTDAIADINNTFIDQPVTGNVLTNDEDYEGDAQTVTDNTDPANGTVVVNPDGTYTYTPNAGFTGQDSFEYTICDDGNPQACDTATVYIEVLPTSGPGNEAPIANADTATTPEGTPINVPVITNDFDPDGDAITVTETTDPANGTVTLNPDGTITYTPEDGFTGEDTFTYTICDDANPALCDTATVTVTVQPTDSPNSTNANDDAYTTTPDTVISDNVLANDNDIEGDAQTVTDNTQPANGTVTIDANGDFTYTPNADFTGTDAFTYTICDDNADQACDTATVYITVGGIANTTDAIADINNTFIDQPVTGNVLTNDEDYEGDAQTVTDNTDPANGTVVVNPDGTYTYTPNAGFTGQDSFEYTICDDGNPQACDTATVYIEVLPTSGPGNEAPIANADTATTPEGTPINVPVITNDFDPDGDAITVTETTDPANGTVTLNPDGTITYTPEDGFTGEDTFTYTICDDANPALCDTATVTVTVQPTDAPNSTNANDDAYTTTPDTVISDNVLANDNDIEGDAQTVTDNTQPANGTVTIDANGDFTYTPNADFTGTDAFTYTICDDNADQACDTATVYITVGGIANTTDAIADINNTFIDQPVTGNVLTNDEDYEGDAQTVTENTDPANGTVVVNPDGTYTYTPNAGFTGQDSFEYTICDDGNPQACDTATVYIEVLPTSGPGNEAPIANADTATTPEGTPINVPVITNDFDPDGDAITVTETTDPANGTVTLNPDGTITYTPEDGFTGEDTFTYTICDDANPALCDTATVTVTVQPTDSPNSTNANDDAYTTTPDTVISDNVLANDNDIEGDAQTVTDNTQPANGTVTIDANGDFTYTPNADFTGTDAFTYTICDDNADQACDTATVYITVGGIANTTDAIADINNTFIDQPVTGNVLTNDEDYEGDAQTVTENTDPANGTVVVNPDGTYTYTPNAGFTGQDSFEYTICDDGNPQACDTATVYIEVLPTSGPGNEAPIANADTATTPEGTPINVPVITNDFDPDGDAITVTETTDPANGTVTLNPDGTITYTPEDGFTGEDTFTYTICDDANPALCDTATVTVTVQPTDAPNSTNANDDAFFASTCGSLSGNVLTNDNDIEGDTQTINSTTVTTVQGVTVTIDATTGEFNYTPISSDFIGNDSFVYTICDDNDNQACDQATVYLSITDSTPPSVVDCSIDDETVECIGTDNESIASDWNAANIAALELCATDSCDSTFSGQITSDYNFDNLVSTCGAAGTLTITYTIADSNNNTTEVVATLTIEDTIAPEPTTVIEETLLAECDNIPDVQTIEFTDNCSSTVDVVFEETNSFDENNPTDYEIIRTWTVSDDCDNSQIFTQTISVTLNDFITTVTDRVCSEDGVIDLNDYLNNGETGSNWIITEGNTTLDGSIFDTENIDLGLYKFTYTSASNGCLNTIEVVIEIHDECVVLPCGKEDVIISKVVTPNGDAQNEFFTITGVETCGFVVELQIFNRWGAKIYENSNYQNDWNGFAHKSSVGNADKVPNGTYYYIINLKNSGLEPIAKAFYVGTK